MSRHRPGIKGGGRALGYRQYGSVRPTLADFDNDGNIDVFTANYGPTLPAPTA